MQYLEIADKATHLVKTGPGYLQGITVNSAGSGWTLQIFDNTTNAAPVIAGATAFPVPAAGKTLTFDCHFSKGLTIVTAGSTAGSITVQFK